MSIFAVVCYRSAMKILLSVLILVIFSSCAQREVSIVPYPNNISFKSGVYDVSKSEEVCVVNIDGTALKNISSFAEDIGADIKISDSPSKCDFVFLHNSSLPEEDYLIDVTRSCVRVEASMPRGFNYAIQTLRQMGTKIPCCHIEDSPRFSYRGLHLDEARHFFGKDEVKKYLDIMAYHKLNTLHWHLTDDQGWRIEIKKYPELTMLGSIRKGTCIKRNYNTNDNVPYGEGMWYTQDDIKEIVEYAAMKGIDIIPEIDLPGHMLAALAAYPHLGCFGGPYHVWHRWGVSEDVLCAGNEHVYDFLEDVLTEVCGLFPGKYIHIGGDECPKTSWKSCPKCQAKIKELGLKDDGDHDAEHYLQSYVMNRVESFLKTKGKNVIGWDEILDGSPSKSATVMSWRGEAGGLKAAELGYDVIMTPNSYCYWDYYQSTDVDSEPFAIGGYVPIDLVYSYEPYTDDMHEQERNRILGVQANIWTEYIATPEHLEYMLLPRLAALSEVQWCKPENKDWSRFLGSMDEVCDAYVKMGYNYAEHIFGVRGLVEPDVEKGCASVVLETQGDTPIRYTVDGTDPHIGSLKYNGPLEISSTCILKASAVRKGVLTRPYVQIFSFHKAVGKNITLKHPSESEFASDGGKELLDGIRGPAIHKSKEWCSWKSKSLDAVIDMEDSEPYSRVEIGYISNKPSQIFNPVNLSVYISEDGENWAEVASVSASAEGEFDSDGLKSMSVSFRQENARYIRVKADCLPIVPEWHHYQGRQAWLYIDEVIVE